MLFIVLQLNTLITDDVIEEYMKNIIVMIVMQMILFKLIFLLNITEIILNKNPIQTKIKMKMKGKERVINDLITNLESEALLIILIKQS